MTQAKKPDQTPIFPKDEYLDDALETARLAMSCIDEMRTFLRAMRELSEDNKVVYDLGRTALDMAADRHNLFDVIRGDLELKKVRKL